jgi:flagellar P-ring protein precursor FlgI
MVDPDQTARVVIDERTGTIVIGADVHISTVAVAHGNITVRVKEKPKVSQPLPFSKGKTVTVPDTDVDVYEAGGNVSTVRGASLRELVSALNHMGLKPIGIIAILQAMKTAGALQAELVVQ